MRTSRVACRLAVLAVVLACFLGIAQATIYYQFTFAPRAEFPQVQFSIAQADLITPADGWITLSPPVVMYGATFTKVAYRNNFSGTATAYVFWTDLNGAQGAANAAYWVEATMPEITYEPTPADPVQSYPSTTKVVVYRGPTEDDFDELSRLGETIVITYGDPPLVKMSSMSAWSRGSGVTIAWETASEVGTAGFQILRSQGGPFEVVSQALIPGQGSAAVGAQYFWTDIRVAAGQTYSYIVQEVEDAGTTNDFGPLTATVPVRSRSR